VAREGGAPMPGNATRETVASSRSMCVVRIFDMSRGGSARYTPGWWSCWQRAAAA
jgi:hypothetical protein